MTSLLKALLASAIVFGASACHANKSPVPDWLVGYWQMIQDQDNGPIGELVEFKSNGTYIFHGKECVQSQPVEFHIHMGEVYVTNFIPDKGPVSVIFHPSDDRKQLSFTSPRTFNNAVYQRVDITSCK